MQPIRVLVVDDSVVMRKALSAALLDPDIDVVGTAADGQIALAKIAQLHPDLITLDVEMPVMSGLEAISKIRKLHRQLPIIMVSSLTERGAATTLDALALGASDYVAKPCDEGNLDATVARIRKDLLPKIKILCGRSRGSCKTVQPSALKKVPLAVPAFFPSASSKINLVAIGTSTGGPNALAELLPALPKDFPVPIVIVQHMPAIFTKALADRLASKAKMEVSEGASGKKLLPGHAFIAPGDFHMTVERKGVDLFLALNQSPPENSCRPAVDVLFRSVAAVCGPNALALVLTGMGSDGVLGSQAIRERGGHVFIQDEDSSVVWGMPGQVAAAGLAHAVFPLQALAAEVNRQVRVNRQPMISNLVAMEFGQ